MRLLLLLVASLVLAASTVSCSGGRESEAGGPPGDGNYVGHWVSEEWTTQLGHATEEYCFGKEGAFQYALHTQAGDNSDWGTYQVEGNRLVMIGRTETLHFSVERLGPNRIRMEGPKVALTYNRDSGRCAPAKVGRKE